MNRKHYNQIRAVVAFFISIMVSLAVTRDNFILATISVFTGMIFMVLVRNKTKIVIDEREKSIREKAAQLTYSIFVPTIGIGSFLLLAPGQGNFIPLSKADFSYLNSLGMVFSYLTLFILTVYAISFHYLNKKYGGSPNEE